MSDTLSQVINLFNASNVITVDDGPYLSSWETWPLTGDPDNQVIYLSWTDGETDYSAVLTEEGVGNGQFDPETGAFNCQDRDGDHTAIKFFTVYQLRQV